MSQSACQSSRICDAPTVGEGRITATADNRTFVPGSRGTIHEAVALLILRYEGFTCQGSGSVCRDDAGPLLLTCAHNVKRWTKEEPGRPIKAESVHVYLGVTAVDKLPLTEIVLKGLDFTVPEGYGQETDQHDWATASLARFTEYLPKFCFHLPVNKDVFTSRSSLYLAGYPGESKPGFPRVSLWLSVFREFVLQPPYISYTVWTSGGYSGSPVYVRGTDGRCYIVGIHVAYSANREENRALLVSQLYPECLDTIKHLLSCVSTTDNGRKPMTQSDSDMITDSLVYIRSQIASQSRHGTGFLCSWKDSCVLVTATCLVCTSDGQKLVPATDIVAHFGKQTMNNNWTTILTIPFENFVFGHNWREAGMAFCFVNHLNNKVPHVMFRISALQKVPSLQTCGFALTGVCGQKNANLYTSECGEVYLRKDKALSYSSFWENLGGPVFYREANEYLAVGVCVNYNAEHCKNQAALLHKELSEQYRGVETLRSFSLPGNAIPLNIRNIDKHTLCVVVDNSILLLGGQFGQEIRRKEMVPAEQNGRNFKPSAAPPLEDSNHVLVTDGDTLELRINAKFHHKISHEIDSIVAVDDTQDKTYVCISNCVLPINTHGRSDSRVIWRSNEIFTHVIWLHDKTLLLGNNSCCLRKSFEDEGVKNWDWRRGFMCGEQASNYSRVPEKSNYLFLLTDQNNINQSVHVACLETGHTKYVIDLNHTALPPVTLLCAVTDGEVMLYRDRDTMLHVIGYPKQRVVKDTADRETFVNLMRAILNNAAVDYALECVGDLFIVRTSSQQNQEALKKMVNSALKNNGAYPSPFEVLYADMPDTVTCENVAQYPGFELEISLMNENSSRYFSGFLMATKEDSTHVYIVTAIHQTIEEGFVHLRFPDGDMRTVRCRSLYQNHSGGGLMMESDVTVIELTADQARQYLSSVDGNGSATIQVFTEPPQKGDGVQFTQGNVTREGSYYSTLYTRHTVLHGVTRPHVPFLERGHSGCLVTMATTQSPAPALGVGLLSLRSPLSDMPEYGNTGQTNNTYLSYVWDIHQVMDSIKQHFQLDLCFLDHETMSRLSESMENEATVTTCCDKTTASYSERCGKICAKLRALYSDKYSSLELLPWGTAEMPMSDVCIPLQFAYGGRHMQEYKQMFEEPSDLYVVRGGSGSGKSTIAKKMAYDWSRGSFAAERDENIVILIRVRNIVATSANAQMPQKDWDIDFATQVAHMYTEAAVTAEEMYQVLFIDTQNTMVILDGLDEYIEGTHPVLDAVFAHDRLTALRPGLTCVCTTRPHVLQGVRVTADVVLADIREVEREYAKQLCELASTELAAWGDGAGEGTGDTDAATEQRFKFDKFYSQFSTLTCVPSRTPLTVLCYWLAWCENKFSSSLFDVYGSTLEVCLHHPKQKKDMDSPTKNRLGRFALKSLLNYDKNTVAFNREDIIEELGELQSGLGVFVNSISGQTEFCNRVWQEYFAALYMVRNTADFSSTLWSREKITARKAKELTMVLAFCASHAGCEQRLWMTVGQYIRRNYSAEADMMFYLSDLYLTNNDIWIDIAYKVYHLTIDRQVDHKLPCAAINYNKTCEIRAHRIQREFNPGMFCNAFKLQSLSIGADNHVTIDHVMTILHYTEELCELRVFGNNLSCTMSESTDKHTCHEGCENNCRAYSLSQDPALPQLLPKLTSLCVSRCKLELESLVCILRHTPSLEELCVPHNHLADSVPRDHIQLPRLRVVNMQDCKLTPQSLLCVLRWTRCLETLDISNNNLQGLAAEFRGEGRDLSLQYLLSIETHNCGLCTADLTSLLTRTPALQQLQAAGNSLCDGVRDRVRLPGLTRVNLKDSKLTFSSLPYVLQWSDRLQEINLTGSDLTAATEILTGVKVVLHVSRVVRLELRECGLLLNNILCVLQNTPLLEHLDVSDNCLQGDPSHLQCDLPRLRCMVMRNCQLSPTTLVLFLSRTRALNTLCVTNNCLGGLQELLGDRSLTLALHHVTTLELGCCDLSLADLLSLLRRTPALTHLLTPEDCLMDSTHNITNIELSHLKVLDVRKSKVPVRTILELLRKAVCLEELNLCGNDLTGAADIVTDFSVSPLRCLLRLDLSHCVLTQHDLLGLLSDTPTLRELCVNDAVISGQSGDTPAAQGSTVTRDTLGLIVTAAPALLSVKVVWHCLYSRPSTRHDFQLTDKYTLKNSHY